VVFKQDINSFQYASEELKGDKEVMLAVVDKFWHGLKFASQALKGDKEVVLVAVNQNGYALQFASEEMKGNKEVVLAAVNRDKYALQFASEELKGNKEVVLAAVNSDGYICFGGPSGVPNLASRTLRDGGLEVYVAGLLTTYTVPSSVFLGTILCATNVHTQDSLLPVAKEAIGGEDGDIYIARRTRFRVSRICLLSKLDLGEYTTTNLMKEIAAFAGVQCQELCGVPWSHVKNFVMVEANRKWSHALRVTRDAEVDKQRAEQSASAVVRFQLMFSEQKLGMGLAASEDLFKLPVIAYVSPDGRCGRVALGDHIESVNEHQLPGRRTPKDDAVMLISQLSRPLRIGFVTGASWLRVCEDNRAAARSRMLAKGALDEARHASAKFASLVQAGRGGGKGKGGNVKGSGNNEQQQQQQLHNCPGGHGLSPFLASNDSWWCSICFENAPRWSKFHGCRQCNFDVCKDCLGLVFCGKSVCCPYPCNSEEADRSR